MNRQINTVSDILEVLRENPEALTELRSVMFQGDSGVTEEKVSEILQLVRRQEEAGVRREEAEARREEAEARREEAEIRRDAAIANMGDAISALVESVEGLRGNMVSLGTDLGQLKGLGVESVLQGRVLQMIGNRLNMDEPVGPYEKISSSLTSKPSRTVDVATSPSAQVCSISRTPS